jgi:hypothetical protein
MTSAPSARLVILLPRTLAIQPAALLMQSILAMCCYDDLWILGPEAQLPYEAHGFAHFGSTSRKMVTDTMADAQMMLEAICIINKVTIGSHDWKFIKATIQNLFQ